VSTGWFANAPEMVCAPIPSVNQSLYSWQMSTEPDARASAEGQLRIQAQGSDRLLQAGASYRIGRDPDADIVVADPRVSWQHAVLSQQGGSWLLQDSGSTNGTFVSRQRVGQIAITGDCAVRLGHPDDGPLLSCSMPAVPDGADGRPAVIHTTARWQPEQPPAGRIATPMPSVQPLSPSGGSRSPSAVMSLPTRRLRIGRASDNDVVVSDLSVSRYHAELRRASRGGFEIVDMDSHNGTFLNGQRITSAPATEADLIGIGPATFRLVGGELQEFIDTGDISLTATDLTVRLSSGKVLLDNVSFALGERCLLGVIGPSGAGKSTLLGALTGISPATDGRMFYDGRDLYRHYAELRHRIGLVPQENILHTQISARRALGYAAELRFPRDTTRAERRRRIDEVLAELALTRHADTRTSALSGGQQKRVNVALELLTKPSLLFLDEPTSGLDPGLDKSVMEMMAELAHDGRTVIVVTHSVANLNLCDRLLVLVPGGKVAFFGPPADGLRHFGKPGWAEVFQAFEAEPGRDWAGEFRRSMYYDRYIASDLNNMPGLARQSASAPPPPAARNRLAQLSTLCRRYLSVISSDRVYLGVLGILPLILGLLIRAVPSPQGLAGTNNADAVSLLLVLTVGACFAGAANAVWELVKERSIYSRERAAGLSAGAYLLSKLLVLGVISAVQAAVMLAIGLTGRPLPAHGAALTHLPLVELLIAMAGLSIASMTLGLLVSAVVNTTDKALPLLVVAVMAQVVLSGGIFPLVGKTGLEQVSWLSPSRWGFAATAATANLNQIEPSPAPQAAASGAAVPTDPLWNHALSTWVTDIAIMLVLALAFATLTWWRLAKMGPAKRG
jgi:ABC transport system ATP-binding/permease protein